MPINRISVKTYVSSRLKKTESKLESTIQVLTNFLTREEEKKRWSSNFYFRTRVLKKKKEIISTGIVERSISAESTLRARTEFCLSL